MLKITEKQREQLKAPLPPESISQHPTKKFLSTIKAIYVVERLNDVFGLGEWKIKHTIIDDEGKMVVVKGVFTINGYDVEIEQFGGNDNADKGDAYKGACTDALTKIASYLEIGIDVFKGLSTNHNKAQNDTSKSLGVCSVCGEGAIKGQYGLFCPNYKKHKADGVKEVINAPINNDKTPF